MIILDRAEKAGRSSATGHLISLGVCCVDPYTEMPATRLPLLDPMLELRPESLGQVCENIGAHLLSRMLRDLLAVS